MSCSQCGTDIITCPRCRTKHCFHHYCPETEEDGKTKRYNQPPKTVWNEEMNQRIIKDLDKVFRKH